MRYWLARFLIFVAIGIIRLARRLGLFVFMFTDVLEDGDFTSSLIELQQMLRDHTNRFLANLKPW